MEEAARKAEVRKVRNERRATRPEEEKVKALATVTASTARLAKEKEACRVTASVAIA